MPLTGGARKRLDALTPKGHRAQIDITITDEGPMAVAFVVISAVPDEKPRESASPKSRTRDTPQRAGGGGLAVIRSRAAIWRGRENALRYPRHRRVLRLRVRRCMGVRHLGITS